MRKVLILDRSKSVRNSLRERLEYEGFSVETTEDSVVALRLCEKIPFDVILTDSVEDFAPEGVPYIVLAPKGSIDLAVKAVQNGASDYLTYPVDMNRLLTAVHRVVSTEGNHDAPDDEKTEHPRDTTRPHPRHSRTSFYADEIVGQSTIIEQLRHEIDKVARCEARVLITGENGTGKELVAHWMHAKSQRVNEPFVEVNCAAIPSELIESELFGHEKGAFTSAIRQRKGKFEQADGGTLFMDEIGDMSLSAQAKVLRALQERKISRVGSDKDIDVDVRVVAATNKNLREEIAKGNFREDLYHRLAVIELKVPPLRKHPNDIPLLANSFMDKLAEEYGSPRKPIDKDAMDALMHKQWTGNVRELKNHIERLYVLSEGKHITLADVEHYC